MNSSYRLPLLVLLIGAVIGGCESRSEKPEAAPLVGYIGGLDGSVELTLNQADTITIEHSYRRDRGSSKMFEFSTALQDGEPYSVTVSQQPENHFCEIRQSEGVFELLDPPIIQVSCDVAMVGFEGVNVMDVVIGHDHACVTSDGPLRCFGVSPLIRAGELDLHDLHFLAAGYDSTCAVDLNGLVCWSVGQDNPILNTPEISGEVLALGVGFDSACLIDSEGLRCWGAETSAIVQSYPRHLSSPTSLTMVDSSACVLDSGKPVCWGHGNVVEAVNLAAADAVDVVDISPSHACALRNGEALCWSGGGNSEAVEVPEDLGAVTQISVSFDHTCATTENGLKCWGSNPFLQHVDKLISYPDKFDLGVSFGCAIENGRLWCFGQAIETGEVVPRY